MLEGKLACTTAKTPQEFSGEVSETALNWQFQGSFKFLQCPGQHGAAGFLWKEPLSRAGSAAVPPAPKPAPAPPRCSPQPPPSSATAFQSYRVLSSLQELTLPFAGNIQHKERLSPRCNELSKIFKLFVVNRYRQQNFTKL